MENIAAYEAAAPFKPFTTWDYIILVCTVFLETVRVLILSIPNNLLSIWHCFVYPAHKSVGGQTALVRLNVKMFCG